MSTILKISYKNCKTNLLVVEIVHSVNVSIPHVISHLSNSPFLGIKSWIRKQKSGGCLGTDDSDLDEHGPACLICGDLADSPCFINLKNCKHIFCKRYIEGDMQDQIAGGEEVS